MMSPPPAFALLLLACWVVLMFGVMNQTGTDQLRASRRDDDTGDGADGFDVTRTR